MTYIGEINSDSKVCHDPEGGATSRPRLEFQRAAVLLADRVDLGEDVAAWRAWVESL